jgi:CHAT domain-containing protein/tetratricopeptide (TPR) repeat protein
MALFCLAATAVFAQNAEFYYNRGNLYYDKGDLDSAVAEYTDALKANPKYTAAYNNRGNAYRNKGDLDAAIVDYTAALALNPEYAAAYNNRGNAYSAKGELDLAIADYTTAIRFNPDYAMAYNNRGIAYYAGGDLDAAIADYAAALALNPEYAAAYNNRGIAYYAKGDLDAAIADYTAALNLKPDFADAYSNRGNAYSAKGDQAAATEDYRRSLEAAARSGNMLDIFYRAWEFTGLLYKNHPFLEDIPRGGDGITAGLAREALAAGIAGVEKAGTDLGARGTALRDRLLYQYYAAVDLEAAAGSPDKAFFYSESLRNRNFLEQMGTAAALGLDGIAPADARRVWELSMDTGNMQELLTNLDPRTPGNPYAEAARRLAGLETELAAVDARITADLSPEGKSRYTRLRNPPPVTAEEARAWLSDDTAVLEYVLWDETVDFAAPASRTGPSSYQDRPSINSYCLVLTKEGVIPVRLDHDTDYVSLVNYLRQNIIEGFDPSWEPMEERRNILYNTLVKPVLDRLPPSVTSLVIVPGGILGHLPFDILRESPDSPDLGQRYRLSFSPSVSVSILAAKNGPPRNTPILALGGVWYGSDGESAGTERRWLDLPGTEAEVRGLEQLVPTGDITLLTGKEAGEQRIKQMSARGELSGYALIHFACNGYFDDLDADGSSLVLSEASGAINTGETGYLTVREIYYLKLNARMVTLSSSETALGLGRGGKMENMVRAFMAAGAGKAGGTLWATNDESTAEFMTRMYRKVLEEGQNFKEAYYQVKKEFRADPRWSHPVYWAAFVLYE